VIICSRNPRLLRRCLRSIARRTSYGNREVIVVQHLAGRQPAMDRLLKSVDCLRVPYAGPFNFAAMNNLAASKASGDILVFLNDDVEPLSAEWLEALVAHAARGEIGAVGARLLYRSGAIQHAGMAIGIMEGAGHPHRDTFAAPFWKWLPFTRNVSAVTGACLAMRKSVFAELGGFDDTFPENYNDVDLCLRAREAGYEVILEPAAVLRHDECRTRRPGVFLEERERFEDRWAEWLERGDLFYSPHFTRRREDAGLELNEIVDLRPRP
jgi:GT2 family glycosyltransferase